jgi:hypothetical protein
MINHFISNIYFIACLPSGMWGAICGQAIPLQFRNHDYE